MENASRRGDASGKASIEERLGEVRCAIDALDESSEAEPAVEPFPEVETAGALASVVLESAQARFGERRFHPSSGEIHPGNWYALWVHLEGVGEVEVRARLLADRPDQAIAIARPPADKRRA